MEVLGRGEDKNNIYGTHILCKSGYRLVVLGILRAFEIKFNIIAGTVALKLLNMASIMKSAHHKSLCNASTDWKGSITLWNFLKGQGQLEENNVSPFLDIHIKDPELFW